MTGPTGARRAGGPGAVRSAREDDLPGLRSIERAAGRGFAALGMTLVAEDEPLTIDELRRYQRDGQAWVRTDGADRAVAYLLAEELDGCAHLEQVSVQPDWAHRRLGQELLARLAAWAADRHLPAITLTTFTDVPWNGPYYRRLGFHIVDDAQLTPGLRRIRRSEADRGLDAWPRSAMRLDLLRPRGPSG